MRRRVGAAALTALALVILIAPARSAHAQTSTAVDYVADLRQARADLATGDVGAARAEVQRAAQLSAGGAMAPILADLDRTPPDTTDAVARLDATLGALDLPVGAVPSDGAAARASLRDTYNRPEFRSLGGSSGDSGLGGLVRRFLNWLGDHDLGVPGGLGWLFALIALALIALVVYRLLRGVSAGRRVTVADEPAAPGDDPDREWALAEEAAARGDHREAIRRAFRSALIAIALRGRLHVNAAWTTRELLAVAAGDADLIAALAPAAAAFDRAWYSPAAVSEADWVVERDRCAALRTLAGRRTAAL